MEPTPIIQLAGVAKHFGGVHALSDITLSITPGQVHALVGENGAGKSTLGKIIIGALRPDAGAMQVSGRHVEYHSPRDALADGVTGIAQEIALVPARSVMENVFLGQQPSRLGVVSHKRLRQRYVELEERTNFNLRIDPDAEVGTLSLADQQQVEILRALARNAKVVVMDESTAALAKTEAKQVFDVVRQLRRNGTTVIYISHFLQEVLDLADHITVLRDGRLVKSVPVADETVDSIVASMLGRPLVQTFPEKRSPQPGAPVRLSVQGLTSGEACQDISFEVRAGEILGLAGLIGAGRTETARAIFGADPAESGTVALDGAVVDLKHPRDAIERGLAYVPESRKDLGLFMERSLIENISLPHLGTFARAGVVRRRREARSCERLLDQVSVPAERSAERVVTLSGGNQQKVLIARWLLSKPSVLIADEPTRGVDVGAKSSIYELIRRLADEGVAIVLISSEHEELIGLANRVLVMRGGRIVVELNEGQISEDRILSAALGGQGEAS